MPIGDGLFDSQAGPFQIRILEGELSVAQVQDNQPPGTIQLVGRAGPFRPIIFEGSQRVKTTSYPGNPIASQQPIGSTEKPTTVGGEWNDRYLGDGQARSLMELLDDLRTRGVSLEVSWGSNLAGDLTNPQVTGQPIVRVGIISNAKFTIDRPQDIAWEVTFDWRSKGQVSSPVISATSKMNPRQDLNQVVDALQMSTSLWEAFSQGTASTFGIPQSVRDGMDRAQAAVDTAVDAIQSGTGAIAQATVIPTQAALQLIGACTNGIQSVLTMEGLLLHLDLLGAEVRDSALDMLRLKDQIFTQLESLGETRGRCATARAGIQEIVQPDVVAEVSAPVGTSLRDLALRFYGDPDLWWAIANFNNLEGSLVPSPASGPSDLPGRPIQIPRLSPGASANLHEAC